MHHLIDPTTGRPGGTGLLSVTTVASDPATAEVWSKCLFLQGADNIAEAAASHHKSLQSSGSSTTGIYSSTQTLTTSYYGQKGE